MKILLLLPLFCPVMLNAQKSQWAVSLNGSGYMTLKGPYLGGVLHAGPQADYFFGKNTFDKYTVFASLGAQFFHDDGEAILVVPFELAAKSDQDDQFFYGGIGGMLHTEGDFLQPSILPTAKLGYRWSTKSGFFADLLFRGFFSYRYKSIAGNYQQPFRRTGFALSPGISFAFGFFL